MTANTPAKKRVMKFPFLKDFGLEYTWRSLPNQNMARFCQIDIKDILDLVTRRQGQCQCLRALLPNSSEAWPTPQHASWRISMNSNNKAKQTSLISIKNWTRPHYIQWTSFIIIIPKLFSEKSYQTKCGYPCMHSCFYAYKFNLKENKDDITPYLLRLPTFLHTGWSMNKINSNQTRISV